MKSELASRKTMSFGDKERISSLNLVFVTLFGTGPSVKVFLMLNSARLGRKRTAMQKKTLNPVYNEAFTFKVTSDTLQRVSFKVVVVNKHSQGPDEQIGHVLLGQNVTGSGISHWNHMLTSLRKPVAMWHLVIPYT